MSVLVCASAQLCMHLYIINMWVCVCGLFTSTSRAVRKTLKRDAILLELRANVRLALAFHTMPQQPQYKVHGARTEHSFYICIWHVVAPGEWKRIILVMCCIHYMRTVDAYAY